MFLVVLICIQNFELIPAYVYAPARALSANIPRPGPLVNPTRQHGASCGNKKCGFLTFGDVQPKYRSLIEEGLVPDRGVRQFG